MKQYDGFYAGYDGERETAAFMRYLAQPHKTSVEAPGVKAPWPYNLLEALFGGHTSDYNGFRGLVGFGWIRRFA